MEIVYLDQNKWVELAHVQAGLISSGPIADLYAELKNAVSRGLVLFPLSASHVLETSKRNNPVSRGHVAETQAALGRGHAYRSRAGRLRVEVRATLCRLFGVKQAPTAENWAIAKGFLQAFESMDDSVGFASVRSRMERINRHLDPALFYINFMKSQDDARRREAHAKLAETVHALVRRMEARRALLTGESVELRRRAYAVHVFMDNQDVFLDELTQMGRSMEQLRALGDHAVRALVDDVPTLNVECELAARLESERTALDPNDVFDIQSFYTAIPYSSRVVAENAAISRARQAKLHSRYGVRLSTSLASLAGVYPS